MKGAIIGDIIGSAYEFNNIAAKDFPLFSSRCSFTDDSVMTCAAAKALLEPERDVSSVFQEVGRRYPNAGYGAKFIHWMFSESPMPYNSCGNGSAMRVSPAGLLAGSVEEAKKLSAKITEISHNHPEGMKGAECTAVCIVLAKQGKTKNEIRDYVRSHYYAMDKTCDDYRLEQAGRHGREICQISVPQALECFFESTDFEDCMRNCISIGGDSDTIAAIAGGIAEACYGVPDEIWERAKEYLPEYLLGMIEKLYAHCSSLKPLDELALELARKYHAGQYYEGSGEPVINHPIAVAALVKGEKEKAVAYLHDAVEDTNATVEEIRALLGDEIADAVAADTRLPGEDYWTYLERVKKNPLALKVKLADLQHNIARETDLSSARYAKHVKAYDIIKAAQKD